MMVLLVHTDYVLTGDSRLAVKRNWSGHKSSQYSSQSQLKLRGLAIANNLCIVQALLLSTYTHIQMSFR